MLLAIPEALAFEYCLGVVTVTIGVTGMAVTVDVTAIVGVGVGVPPCYIVHP